MSKEKTYVVKRDSLWFNDEEFTHEDKVTMPESAAKQSVECGALEECDGEPTVKVEATPDELAAAQAKADAAALAKAKAAVKAPATKAPTKKK